MPANGAQDRLVRDDPVIGDVVGVAAGDQAVGSNLYEALLMHGARVDGR